MILPTPLERAPEELSRGCELYLKREDLHELGAFKWRGALPTLESYQARGASAVVTASTGNHGAATAWAARRLGLSAIVFVPARASAEKLELIRALRAEIRAAGADFDAAKDAGRAFASERNLPFFEDGSEATQYQGYAAIGREILEQLPIRPSHVVVPVGNGALIVGIGWGLRSREGAPIRLVGVAAREAPVMALSFDASRPVACERMATFADGLAVRVAIPEAVVEMRRVVERMLLVSEREIAQALGAFARVGIRVEGAAAAGLAAVSKLERASGPVVLIVTGRNIDEEIYRRAVDHPETFSA